MQFIDAWPIRKLRTAPAKRSSLFIVSVPKSGTVYLNRALGRSLGLRNARLCHGYFPQDHICVERLHEFVTIGGCIAASHIDPSPANLHLLDALMPRWVVHVRDPRASLLSWAHHTQRLHQEGRQLDLMRVCPTPPVSILAGNLRDCIDWHIDRFYRPLVAWIGAWVEVADAWPHRVLLTEYAALHDDEQALCREIADFIGHASSRYRHRTAARTMANHFRAGALDEWQHVFTTEQIRHTTSMLPPELCQLFDWPCDMCAATTLTRDWRAGMAMASTTQEG